MILRRFVWRDDPATQNDGWVLAGGPPEFDGGLGMQVAHDCFEHLNYDGSIESELMAFGAMIYIRAGTHDYWNTKQMRGKCSTAELIADDLARFLVERLLDVKPLKTKPLDDEEDEHTIREMPRYVVKLLRDELSMRSHEPTYLTIRAALRNAQHWMRRGYRLTKLRWPQSRDTLCELFMAVEDDVERLSKHAYEGAKLEVRLHFNKPRHDVTLAGYGTWH